MLFYFGECAHAALNVQRKCNIEFIASTTIVQTNVNICMEERLHNVFILS